MPAFFEDEVRHAKSVAQHRWIPIDGKTYCGIVAYFQLTSNYFSCVPDRISPYGDTEKTPF